MGADGLSRGAGHVSRTRQKANRKGQECFCHSERSEECRCESFLLGSEREPSPAERDRNDTFKGAEGSGARFGFAICLLTCSCGLVSLVGHRGRIGKPALSHGERVDRRRRFSAGAGQVRGFSQKPRTPKPGVRATRWSLGLKAMASLSSLPWRAWRQAP